MFAASVAAETPSRNMTAAKNNTTSSLLSPLELCRLFPIWRGHDSVSQDICKKATDFNPQRYDLFNGSSLEFSSHNPKWAGNLMDCMDEAQEERYAACAARTDCDENALEASIAPTVKLMLPSPDDPVAVIVENAFNKQEAATLEDLKRCIHKYHKRSLLEHRPFAYGIDGQEYKGGNDCTFLGGFLQTFAPGVAAQVKYVGHLAWKAAKWGEIVVASNKGVEQLYVDPKKTGIRTSGHLSYEGWDELGLHADSGSLYTVLFMLSDPVDYDGGELKFVNKEYSITKAELTVLWRQFAPLLTISFCFLR